MSQHDYNLANQSGLNFRSDLNNVLSAIVGQNSGTTEPSTTFAYQLWMDTTTGLLKIRNAANNAWLTIGDPAKYALGLGAPFSGSSEPTVPYAYQYWIDTSGSPKVLKIRNAANADWITIGTVEAANYGLLPLAGGTMTAPIQFSITSHTFVPVGTTAQRDVAPAAGMVRFNSDLDQFEFYNGAAWAQGGGGGGVSVSWLEDENAPAFLPQNKVRTWAFEAGLGQALYALVKVPASYTAGQQLNLKAAFYSADTSGNVYFKTTTTLIRSGVDAITSTTNQRTSSQGAVTVSAGTVNEPQVITCDLTDTDGTVNSVAVSANDLLLIQLFRLDSDTATGTAYLLPELSEVK